MAIIREWASDEQFDEKLRAIKHYRNHPELLPFIGRHYEKARILLVGESHYIKNIDQEGEAYRSYYAEQWYREPLPDGFPHHLWFTTRYVIHRFQVNRRSRSYSMFRNPAEEALQAWELENVTDSEVFNAFAFMNYFQKPAAQAGESFDNSGDYIGEDSEEDAGDTIDNNKQAYRNLLAVIDILKPKLVIFLSKKAYNVFIKQKKDEKTQSKCPDIKAVVHPTCSHWSNSEDGAAAFNTIIKDYKPDCAFDTFCLKAPDQQRRDLQAVLPPELKEPKAEVTKRTVLADSVRYQLRTDKQTGLINEIVFRKLIGSRKIGIGYRFDYKYLWVWDYGEDTYCESYSDSPELSKFYQEIYKIIERL